MRVRAVSLSAHACCVMGVVCLARVWHVCFFPCVCVRGYCRLGDEQVSWKGDI